MPTKINGSGGQQEYVPAGHGQASGEYGDSTGSNKNFKSFKNPDKKESSDAQSNQIKNGSDISPKEQPKPKRDFTKVYDSDTIKVVEGQNGKEVKKSYQEMLNSDLMSEESKEYISTISDAGIAIGVTKGTSLYSGTNKAVMMNIDRVNDKYGADVLVHEYTHAADYNYIIPKDKFKDTVFEWETKVYGTAIKDKSFPKLSTNYVTSTGKTMSETFFEEIDQKTIAQIKADAAAEHTKFKEDNTFIEPYTFYTNALSKHLQDTGVTKEALMKKGFSEDRATIAIREAEYDWREKNKYQKWLDKNPNARKSKLEYLEKEMEFRQSWSSMSDIVSGFENGKGIYCINFGHDSSYYPKFTGKKGGLAKNNLSTEVFAQIGEAGNAKRHNKKKMELFQKYCPKTTEAFNEIKSTIMNNKLKVNTRKTGNSIWNDYK